MTQHQAMTELLSKDHPILEKGSMEHRPFGIDLRGENIRDVSGLTVKANVEYLEEAVGRRQGPEAGARAVEQLCQLLNERIRDPSYYVSPTFLKNVWHSYSYEFVCFLGEFCRLLSDNPRFQFHVGKEKFISPIMQTSVVPSRFPRFTRCSCTSARSSPRRLYSSRSER